MIPKIIHYIWLGDKPLSDLVEQCIVSWKEHMPEWEYMEWTEASLTRVLNQPIPGNVLRTTTGSPIEQSSSPVKGRTFEHPQKQSQEKRSWLDYMPVYVRQAYEARKYAFVSDYVRLWALEQYGGVYLDTDVMVLKSYEPLLNDIAFIGLEESKAHLPGTCVMGCEAHCQWAKDMLALYDDIVFVKSDGTLDLTTNVQRMGGVMMKELRDEGIKELKSERRNKSEEIKDNSERVKELGGEGKMDNVSCMMCDVSKFKWWKENQYINKWGLRIYTHDYFSPITSTRVMRKTSNTYSIHYFAGSWMDGKHASGWRNWTIMREIVNALVQIKRWICCILVKR